MSVFGPVCVQDSLLTQPVVFGPDHMQANAATLLN